MIVPHLRRMVVDLIREELPQAEVLVKLEGQLPHRFVHHADVVDGVHLHHLNYLGEVAGPAYDMVVLEDQDEFMRDFGHNISDIFGKSASFTPLLNHNPLLGVILLLEANFEFLVLLIGGLRDNSALVLTNPFLCDFDAIADDEDGGVGERGLLEDAGDGHIDDICCWVVSDGTGGDDYGQICGGNRVVVTLLHGDNKRNQYKWKYPYPSRINQDLMKTYDYFIHFLESSGECFDPSFQQQAAPIELSLTSDPPFQYLQIDILPMSDPTRRQPNRQQQHHPQIDEPDVFLSLGPHPHHQSPRHQNQPENQGRSESLSDEDYIPEPIEEDDENKNEEVDAYEAESLNLQDEEEEKSVTNRSRRQPSERPAIQLQARSSVANDEKSNKSAPKSRKRGKKKVVESQDDDEYSGEYVMRKKGKPRESKKGNKRNEMTRSRGKPRGRGSHASRHNEIKKEYIYPDEVPQKSERLRNNRKAEPVPPQPNYIMAPFSTSWRVAEENQQDWDSQDASIWSESANRREQYASEIINLIESKPENIVSLIANLPPLLYHTFH